MLTTKPQSYMYYKLHTRLLILTTKRKDKGIYRNIDMPIFQKILSVLLYDDIFYINSFCTFEDQGFCVAFHLLSDNTMSTQFLKNMIKDKNSS